MRYQTFIWIVSQFDGDESVDINLQSLAAAAAAGSFHFTLQKFSRIIDIHVISGKVIRRSDINISRLLLLILHVKQHFIFYM